MNEFTGGIIVSRQEWPVLARERHTIRRAYRCDRVNGVPQSLARLQALALLGHFMDQFGGTPHRIDR